MCRALTAWAELRLFKHLTSAAADRNDSRLALPHFDTLSGLELTPPFNHDAISSGPKGDAATPFLSDVVEATGPLPGEPAT